jgi:hypothetical protein
MESSSDDELFMWERTSKIHGTTPKEPNFNTMNLKMNLSNEL